MSLLIPSGDISDPKVTLLVPALNEETTIERFVDWSLEGLARAGVKGEVFIPDASTDRTAELACRRGARVFQLKERGLGLAYRRAIPHIRGEFVILGDCDCTYDFRELVPFIEKLEEGFEFVMGNRFSGSIEEGAMPPLHRYFGIPVTTWLLNTLFRSRFSDIHCGMRALTKAALIRMNLQSDSWEYASEMVIKSIQLKLKTTEVPIRYLKAPDGRLSHHKRLGWFSPWHAGLRNLNTMWTYGVVNR